MNWNRKSTLLFFATSLLVLSASVHATTMLQMDLGDLTTRADKVFRGTVISADEGTVAAGGGQLPVVTYRFAVTDLYKGEADQVKGEDAWMEVRMVGRLYGNKPGANNVARFSLLDDVPRFDVGSEYVLFVTPSSSAGLSMTVGLGQGAFRVFLQNDEDAVVNAYNNSGLGLGANGPVKYTELAASIQALLSQ